MGCLRVRFRVRLELRADPEPLLRGYDPGGTGRAGAGHHRPPGRTRRSQHDRVGRWRRRRRRHVGGDAAQRRRLRGGQDGRHSGHLHRARLRRPLAAGGYHHGHRDHGQQPTRRQWPRRDKPGPSRRRRLFRTASLHPRYRGSHLPGSPGRSTGRRNGQRPAAGGLRGRCGARRIAGDLGEPGGPGRTRSSGRSRPQLRPRLCRHRGRDLRHNRVPDVHRPSRPVRAHRRRRGGGHGGAGAVLRGRDLLRARRQHCVGGVLGVDGWLHVGRGFPGCPRPR